MAFAGRAARAFLTSFRMVGILNNKLIIAAKWLAPAAYSDEGVCALRFVNKGGRAVTKKELLDRCARDREERVLLARVLDRLELAQCRDVPAHTAFLSPGEQASVTDLLNAWGRPRHLFWGGYPDSERKVCIFPSSWADDESCTAVPEGPVAAFQAKFPPEAKLTHRDILGSLMGLGITRAVLGDILMPGPGLCQVIALRESLPILLSQWEGAGRWKVDLAQIPLEQVVLQPVQVRTIRDTVATPRLDAVLAAGFSVSRGRAAGLISTGKVSLNHRVCQKTDRQVAQGDVLTCRGLGKCVVKEVPGQSKKGRTVLVLERYV